MFGLGKIKPIPGTYGSLATVIILYFFFHILSVSSNLILLGLLIIFVISFFSVALHIKDSDNKDPKEVVIDEFIGQAIPIYLYEIAHNIQKDPQESILFYLYIFLVKIAFFTPYRPCFKNRPTGGSTSDAL